MPSTYRDQVIRHACRQIGSTMNMYVSGDPHPDDIAEYLASAWLLTDDYYAGDDEPSAPRDVNELLQRALRLQAQALSRLAEELDAGDITLDSLRRIDLPRVSPAAPSS